ncbi:hypothetical protein [Tumidithrix elongata]
MVIHSLSSLRSNFTLYFATQVRKSSTAIAIRSGRATILVECS